MTTTTTTPTHPPDSFAALFEASQEAQEKIKEGEIVQGTVLRVGKENVVVDIGYKSEGVIPVSEFTAASGEISVQPGDRVDVLVESREDDNGLVLLSKEKADKMKVWDEISAACERDEIIEGTISARVKGGLSVTIKGGVKAFLPGSQVDLRPIRNLDKMIGQAFPFKVIKFNKKRGNIVLSRRVLLEKERDELKVTTLKNLTDGMVTKGTIKNITEYGAFVDLGGIDGLLHITDMSWGRVNHPSELFNVGDEVTVKVLKYNAENERVSLGLKQTMEDPWGHAEEAYPPGKKVHGKVVSITDYGAFVELEPGVEGLVHVSEMSWTKRVKHPKNLLNVGDDIECQVLEVDVKSKRISLSIKELEPDPWTLFVNEFNPGDKVSGKVRSITDYGIFIGIRDGVDGMVHKTDLSWTARVVNPADLYQRNDDVEAVILSINHDDKKVSLGIKQMFDDPWSRIPNDYSPGKSVEGKVTSIFEGGIYVALEDGIDGYIPTHEFSAEVAEGTRKIKRGEALRLDVASLDMNDRRILLSMRTAATRGAEEESAPRASGDKPAAARDTRRGGTLGDLIKEKLGDQLGDLPTKG
ncbi:MAG: 30S ribosomal protein S1 [Myxococcales bacterium]|nr:30S ribosomal protein S1 [Myxococcales bacterium]